MAEMVEFASNGNDARGYLVLPETGTGPGVIVIQEWWGLDSGTKEMADRLAAAGFVLYNVFSDELPSEDGVRFPVFAAAAGLYAVLLLVVVAFE